LLPLKPFHLLRSIPGGFYDIFENFRLLFEVELLNRPIIPGSADTAPNSLFKPSQFFSWDGSKNAKTSIKCGLGRWDTFIPRSPGGENSFAPLPLPFPKNAKTSVGRMRLVTLGTLGTLGTLPKPARGGENLGLGI